MPTANRPEEGTRQRELAWVESVWGRIERHLDAEYDRVNGEIKRYPRPIPACDLQFNYLLEQRSRLAQELERLREAAGESFQAAAPKKLIEEFLRSSTSITDEVKHTVVSLLKEGFPGLGP
jgi:regulator of replication initiation timing